MLYLLNVSINGYNAISIYFNIKANSMVSKMKCRMNSRHANCMPWAETEAHFIMYKTGGQQCLPFGELEEINETYAKNH